MASSLHRRYLKNKIGMLRTDSQKTDLDISDPVNNHPDVGPEEDFNLEKRNSYRDLREPLDEEIEIYSAVPHSTRVRSNVSPVPPARKVRGAKAPRTVTENKNFREVSLQEGGNSKTKRAPNADDVESSAKEIRRPPPADSTSEASKTDDGKREDGEGNTADAPEGKSRVSRFSRSISEHWNAFSTLSRKVTEDVAGRIQKGKQQIRNIRNSRSQVDIDDKVKDGTSEDSKDSKLRNPPNGEKENHEERTTSGKSNRMASEIDKTAKLSRMSPDAAKVGKKGVSLQNRGEKNRERYKGNDAAKSEKESESKSKKFNREKYIEPYLRKTSLERSLDHIPFTLENRDDYEKQFKCTPKNFEQKTVPQPTPRKHIKSVQSEFMKSRVSDDGGENGPPDFEVRSVRMKASTLHGNGSEERRHSNSSAENEDCDPYLEHENDKNRRQSEESEHDHKKIECDYDKHHYPEYRNEFDEDTPENVEHYETYNGYKQHRTQAELENACNKEKRRRIELEQDYDYKGYYDYKNEDQFHKDERQYTERHEGSNGYKHPEYGSVVSKERRQRLELEQEYDYSRHDDYGNEYDKRQYLENTSVEHEDRYPECRNQCNEEKNENLEHERKHDDCRLDRSSCGNGRNKGEHHYQDHELENANDSMEYEIKQSEQEILHSEYEIRHSEYEIKHSEHEIRHSEYEIKHSEHEPRVINNDQRLGAENKISRNNRLTTEHELNNSNNQRRKDSDEICSDRTFDGENKNGENHPGHFADDFDCSSNVCSDSSGSTLRRRRSSSVSPSEDHQRKCKERDEHSERCPSTSTVRVDIPPNHEAERPEMVRSPRRTVVNLSSTSGDDRVEQFV